jgi:hypothetical protein
MKKIKRTVGLIVLSNTEDKGLVAVLQVRGDFNTEKNNEETYRGASQITVHGSISEGEKETDTLLRETREELGEGFAEMVEAELNKDENFMELNRIENENISVANFGTIVDESALKEIEVNVDTGGSIRLISKSDVENIRELKPEDREAGVAEDEIVMFPDDIEAVKLAFEKFNGV